MMASKMTSVEFSRPPYCLTTLSQHCFLRVQDLDCWSSQNSNPSTEVIRHDSNKLFITTNWNCMFLYTQLAIKNNSRNLLKIKNNGTLHEMLSLQAAYSGSIITGQCTT